MLLFAITRIYVKHLQRGICSLCLTKDLGKLLLMEFLNFETGNFYESPRTIWFENTIWFWKTKDLMVSFVSAALSGAEVWHDKPSLLRRFTLNDYEEGSLFLWETATEKHRYKALKLKTNLKMEICLNPEEQYNIQIQM